MFFGPRNKLNTCIIDSVDLSGVKILVFIPNPEPPSQDTRVKRMTSTYFYQIQQLKATRRSLNRDAAEKIDHVFETIPLDYCNSLLYN